MSIIVFDGVSLVCDGRSAVPAHGMAMAVDSVTKITKLSTPYPTGNPRESIIALGMVGCQEHGTRVMDEVKYSANTGTPYGVMCARMSRLLDDVFDCIVIGIIRIEGPTPSFGVTVVFSSSRHKRSAKQTWLKRNMFCVVGDTVSVPSWKLGEHAKSSVEIASISAAMSPYRVGGMLTRFNVKTGKIDHPNYSPKNRVQSLIKKWKAQELDKLMTDFDAGIKQAEFINKYNEV